MTSDGNASDSDGSDINIQSALSKMASNKKQPEHSPTGFLKKKSDKKMTTKTMILQALVDLKSRKGVSLQAIKKYIGERYSVDTEKINYYIKKAIKSAVEDGTIIQTKGIGASGSFKLAPVKEKKKKAKKTKKPKTEKTEKTKDPEKIKDPEKKKKKSKEPKKTEGKSLKSKVKSKEGKEDTKKIAQPKKKMDKEKKPKEKKDGVENKKVMIGKDIQKTPSKKKAMLRRKSIGSLIKPPKMKPRAKT